MALSRETVTDKIEILETGHIQIRHATYIVEDGERVSGPEYRRTVIAPGEAISPETPAQISEIAAIMWTPTVVAAYDAIKQPPLK